MPSWPSVTLKLASSLDGKIALGDGRSKWITGAQARACVHEMRSRHDAILTGIGTILADDPQMTARPEGQPTPHQPHRVIMDTDLRTPANARILEPGMTTVFHGPDAAIAPLKDRGIGCIQVELDANGSASLDQALEHLSQAGIGSVMIESGGRVARTALQLGCVGRIEWFRAPVILGGDALSCVAALALESLQSAPQFRRTGLREVGADLWETYERG